MKFKLTAVCLAAVLLISGCTQDISDGLPVMATVGNTSEPTSNTAFVTTQYTEPVTKTETETLPPETTAAAETIAETSAETTAAETKPVFSEPDTEKFSEEMQKIYSDYYIKGMSVVLFMDGKIVHTENIGYADVENEIPCDDNTRYRIASTSKLISTIALMKLYDEGLINPESYLTDVTGIDFDDPNSDKIKLRHLLTHTSGIIDTYLYEDSVYRKYTIDEILKSAHTGYKPGTNYCYSNFGAGCIGAVIESITGEFFHDYAKDVLFDPLGMDAGYVIDLIEDKSSCAKLYDYDGEIFDVANWRRTSDYYESFGLGNSYMAAQCELIITPSDLARLGIALAGDGTFDGKRVLSEEAVNLINTRYFSAPNFDMGLNVRIYDNLIEGHTIYGHPGNALGVITGLYYDRDYNVGAAFLTNRCYMLVDNNGFYRAIRDTLEAAYDCYFR